MKHISIGDLYKNDESNFSLSLFDSKINKDFKSLKEALSEIKKHASKIIKDEYIDGFSIKYHYGDKKFHNIIVDKYPLHTDFNCKIQEPVIYEQTQYEFLRTHVVKKNKRSYRKMVNERGFSFKDVLRTSVYEGVHSTWTSIISLLAIFISTIALFLSSLEFTLMPETLFKKSDMTKGFNLILISNCLIWLMLVIYLPFFVGFVKAKKKGVDINWRFWYRLRFFFKNIAITLILAATIILIYTISFLDGINLLFSDVSSKTNLISSFVVSELTILVIFLIYLVFSLVATKFKIIKSSNHYYNNEERAHFKKWLKNEADEYYKENRDIFLFDSDVSRYFFNMSKESNHSILLNMEKNEKKRFRTQIFDSHKRAINNYLERFKK